MMGPSMNFYCRKNINNNKGFTLVEVLVALIILSIGLLAVASMQTNSLRSNNSALIRSKAVLGCEDILDRMRANRDAALAGDYVIAMTVAPASPTYTGMVLTDLQEWKNALANNLPAGDGSVTLAGSVATATVQWVDSLGTDSVVMEARL